MKEGYTVPELPSIHFLIQLNHKTWLIHFPEIHILGENTEEKRNCLHVLPCGVKLNDIMAEKEEVCALNIIITNMVALLVMVARILRQAP